MRINTRFPGADGLLTVAGRLAALLLLSIATLGIALADEGDPPGRVARLSYTQGSVSLQPAGVQDWAAAVVNRPLTTGDKVWTDQGSRAELDIGAAVIRLGDTTGFSFLSLDDNTAQMQVTAGTVLVHVRELLDNQTYEIDTPNLAVQLESPGEYRVEVNDAGDTTVVRVSNGQAEATGNGQSIPIQSQQMVTFIGTDQLSTSTATLGGPDGLDEWSMERDRRFEQAQSRQYVPDNVAGTQDLDANGQWENTPDYGYVWTPTTVVAGWAPYSFGHWAWVGPWGWTWVDDAPWGFAPFHYGRWARWHDSWCWVPGPRHIRPVYAPAMVAWVGGSRFGVSVGVGSGVGWFPLGPREVYVPGYHVSDRYVRNVNITNTTIVNNTYITNVYRGRVSGIRYANSGIPGAVTAVPRDVFTSAQSVGGHRMRLPPNQSGRFSPTGAPPAIAPDRQSVLGASGGRFVRRPPPELVNRPVLARTPPPPAPVSFDRQQAAIRANGGRPLPRDQMVRLQPSAPSAQVRVVTPPQQMGRGAPGFNRPGSPVEQGGRGPGFGRPGVSALQGGREPGAAAPGQPGQQQGRGPGFDRPGTSALPGGREPGAAGPAQPSPQQGHGPGFDRFGQPAQQAERGNRFTRPDSPTPQGAGEPRADRPPGTSGLQGGSGPAFGRPGPAVQQQPRPENSSSPPSAGPGADRRAITEREHVLENSNLPRAQGPRDDRPPGREVGGMPAQNGLSPNRGGWRGGDRPQNFQTAPPPQEAAPNIDRSAERPNSRSFSTAPSPPPVQPNRMEEARPPVNVYSRPPMENRTIEGSRPMSVPPPPPAPVPRFAAPPPPPAPVPHFNAPPPPPAPVPRSAAPSPAPAPQQRAPAPSREERGGPGAQGRRDLPRG
jgi:hypothetical protein